MNFRRIPLAVDGGGELVFFCLHLIYLLSIHLASSMDEMEQAQS